MEYLCFFSYTVKMSASKDYKDKTHMLSWRGETNCLKFFMIICE